VTDLPSSDELATRYAEVLDEAAVVAHDLNNLLLVIRGRCAVLLKRATDDVSREQLHEIDAAAGSAAELTLRLLERADRALNAPS
jgi:signal transduction histidine kinase